MIWIAKDLDYFVETTRPEMWGDSVTLFGKSMKRLTPPMFGALYQHMRDKAKREALTVEEIKKLAQLEQTICALGLGEKYYAHVTKDTQADKDGEAA